MPLLRAVRSEWRQRAMFHPEQPYYRAPVPVVRPVVVASVLYVPVLGVLSRRSQVAVVDVAVVVSRILAPAILRGPSRCTWPPAGRPGLTTAVFHE